VLFEGIYGFPMTAFASLSRPVDAWLAGQKEVQAVVEYPWNMLINRQAPVHQMTHGWPIVNGNTGTSAPRTFYQVAPEVPKEWPDVATLRRLQKLDVTYLLMHRSKDVTPRQFEAERLQPLRKSGLVCEVASFPNPGDTYYPDVNVFRVLQPGEICTRPTS
jgi:hypothetical protein